MLLFVSAIPVVGVVVVMWSSYQCLFIIILVRLVLIQCEMYIYSINSKTVNMAEDVVRYRNFCVTKLHIMIFRQVTIVIDVRMK